MANSGHKPPLDVATTASASSNGGSNMPLSEPPGSRGSVMTDTTPTLVAPVPRYASAQAQELSLYNSAQTNASSAPPDDKVGDDRIAAFLAVLPRQGATQDAQAAVDKLERMRRAKEHKRRWLNGTGIAGLAHLATAKAKEKTPKQRRRKDKTGDVDDGSDADSTASSLNLYGEVRLAISSMPGFNVLSTKASAARRERAESPPPHGEDEGRSSAFRFGSARRRSSLVPPSPSLQQRQHSLATNGPLVQAQTDAVLDAPSLSADSAPAPTVAKQITPACDLDTLKEERRIEEATDVLTRPETATKPAIKPKAERPRLMLQSPSEDINVPDGDMMQSPEDMQLTEGRFNDTRAPSSDGASPRFNGYAMPPTPPGQCDLDAYAAAEQCRKDLSRRTLMDESGACDPQMAESIGAESSGVGGSDGSESDSEGSTDMDESYEQQQAMFVSLQHGNEMSPKEKKKLLRRIRRRSKRQSEGEGGGTVGRSQAGDVGTNATATANGRRQQQPKLSLSNHISTGLHYATSQSRNRRAIERYSPHPSRPGSAKPFQSGTLGGMTALSASPPIGPTTANGNISRSSTPGNALQSERSSLSNEEGRDAVAPINSWPSSIAMADGDDDLSRMDEHKGQLLRRWGTNQSMVSNAASTGKGASLKNRIMSLRRNRNQPSDVAEEGDDATPRREQDAAEHELDTALRRLAAQEAPEEVGEQYAYDVLYENQRGMLFFGIPKFGAKTLFQWDPAAWTNGRNGNSAYNVVNAQLPDPSWEWVHEEWMIDMSGNVDESGWQYSYNFRTVHLPLMKRPAQAVPRGGRDGNRQMNEQFNKEMDGLSKREAKTAHREDDGLEALKRSAIARQAKWTGIPTQNTYVRRRRWIRLRRRKPMEVHTASANTPKAEVPFGVSKGSMDWAQLVKEGKARENKTQSQLDVNEDAALSDVEEGTATNTSSSSSSSDELEEGPADGRGESDFLARRVYGHLRSGADPLAERTSKEHSRRRRHAREFTGTIRELKSLLPSILDRRGGRAHRSTASRQKALWLAEIDARNPFISWSYVKRRLEDDDLAFATTTLRARERRHAKRASERRERAGSRGGSRDGHDGSATPPPPLSDHFELTKDALVEINFRRVLRVIKACKLDRQKVQLWRLWLNVDQLNASNTETSRNEDLIELGLAASAAAASEHLLRDKAELMRLARTRWRNAYTPTDAMDVWDVVERRLDRLLLTFEFQSSRAAFLRLLLTIHAASHAVHRFRPAQPMRVGTSPSPRLPTAEEVGVPASLSMTPAGDEWRAARVPRLEFWSDLIDCARSVVATTTMTKADQSGSPSMLLHEQSSGASPRVIGTESTPITVPGLSFAMRPLSRSTTPIDGSAPPSSSIRHARKGSSSVGSERQSSPRVRSAHFPSGSITEWSNFGGGSSTAAARLQSGSPSPSTSALLHDADSAFLARLLQVPVQRQKDIILQSCGSVFETKTNAQTHVEPAADEKAAAAAHEREDSEVVRRLSAALDRDM